MVAFYLHGRAIESVFELLGSKENDITYSIGWALAHSPQLAQAVLSHVFPRSPSLEPSDVRLQEWLTSSGKTDIEIVGPRIHVVIEAKRGWCLPGKDQLERYLPRFDDSNRELRAYITMSEASSDYAGRRLPPNVGGVPVRHLSWRDVQGMTDIREGTHAEKRLLRQLSTYLEKIVKVQNPQSNWVYVVSLSTDRPDWSELSWIEIVQKKERYFHPADRPGWPKEPPNYIGFRYHGQLQSIHHVEEWKMVDHDTVRIDIPEVSPSHWDDHVLYRLGPPIVPPKPVKTGKIFRNGRVWAMLDLLLTCDTISDARDRSKERIAGDLSDADNGDET